MNNVGREIKNPLKKVLGSKTLTKIRNAFGGLMNKLDAAEERIAELEDTAIENFKSDRTQSKRKSKDYETTKHTAKYFLMAWKDFVRIAAWT